MVVFFAFAKALSAQTQESNRAPIPIEVMFGSEKMNYLAILNLRFSEASKFGYFGVASVLAPYDNDDGSNELVLTNLLTYNVSKKFQAVGGVQYHYAKGVLPAAGAQFFSASPTWLFLFSSTLQFASNTNIENVGIIEYKPRLSEGLRLYSRLQGLYNQNLSDDLHDRSLFYVRAGISIGKTSFGLGANLDFYRASRAREESFGIFINHLF
ncbi:hypothetical protein [Aquimarina sp. U1-2]|uniref:hypothetical protein n=1 Tax=Aquimarina sp. U1-2 TaxID=2823141 RepID=UPI001AECA632|nr:hypothetical protein [Aquimarina sp. U1-2]